MLHPRLSHPTLAARARSSRFGRATVLPLSLVFVAALAVAAVSSRQLESLEQETLPALRDAQHLETTASTMPLVLRGADLGRADSIATDFQAVASREERSDAVRADMDRYSAAFTDYYVSARRAAAGTSMSDEPDMTSAEHAALASGVLTERLHDGVAAASLAVERSPAAILRIRIVAGLLIAAAAALALMILIPRRSTRQHEDVLPERRPELATPAERDEERTHLQEAVRRLAERRQAVAAAAAVVAERNRQQIELLQKLEHADTFAAPEQPTLKVIRGGDQSATFRTPVHSSFALGKRAAIGV